MSAPADTVMTVTASRPLRNGAGLCLRGRGQTAPAPTAQELAALADLTAVRPGEEAA